MQRVKFKFKDQLVLKTIHQEILDKKNQLDGKIALS